MKTILFVGTDILNYKSSGDKNFWLELFDNLDKTKFKISILSINNLKEDTKYKNIKIFNLNPISFKKNSSNKVDKSFHRNYYEKTLSLVKLIPKIKFIIKSEKVDIVHFIDNYGPLMYLFKPFMRSTKLTCNAIVYNPTFKFYDSFLRLSFSNFDKIISYSEAYKNILNKWNFKNVEVIHWGVIPSIYSHKNKNNKSIIWTGNLQQTGEKEFYYSLNFANKLIELDPKISFNFIFKPEHFKEKYKNLSNERILIDKSSGKDFNQLIRQYNFLLCPILNKKSTIGPPLTWIESLNNGIPIITNKNSGCEEIINKNNGFVFDEINYNLILNFIKNNNHNYSKISKNAQMTIKEDYNILKITKQYENLWGNLK
jgi:glycosyltransferase involved in cell wall biosynthesis